MSAELKEIAQEYLNLKTSLSGYSHSESLDEEFKRLHDLEQQIFTDANVFETPDILLKANVIVRQGEANAESSSYYQGTVQGIEKGANGQLVGLLIKESDEQKNFRVVPVHPNISHISVLQTQVGPKS